MAFIMAIVFVLKSTFYIACYSVTLMLIFLKIFLLLIYWNFSAKAAHKVG